LIEKNIVQSVVEKNKVLNMEEEKQCKVTIMMWHGKKGRCVKSKGHKGKHYCGSAWSGFVWNDGDAIPTPSDEL